MRHRSSVAPFLLVLSLVSALTGRLASQDPEPKSSDPSPPNLLLIITDDQRYDALSCAGHPHLRTPSFDRLAAEGVRFRNAFVSTSICAASRATILTGLWETAHGFTFGTPPLSADHPTWPETLRGRGYRSGYVGKLGVKLGGREKDLFDWFRRKDGRRYPAPDAGPDEVHLTDEIAADAVGFLRESAASGEQPFCLTMAFRAPHADDGDPRQYVAPRDLSAQFADMPVPRHPLEDPAVFEALPPLLQQSMGRKRFYWRFDEAEKRARMIREYYAMIAGIDRAVGRVLTALDELDQADDTVIVFISDNGYFLGERGMAGKWLAYERSIRVPLIVRDPRRPALAGSVRDEVVLNVDLAPTLLAAAGAPVPATMQGESLWPLVDGEASDWRDEFFYEHRMRNELIPICEGLRTPRYTYARYWKMDSLGDGFAAAVDKGLAIEQLFDREGDPEQLQDLAGDAEHAELLDEMRRRTADWHRKLGGGD